MASAVGGDAGTTHSGRGAVTFLFTDIEGSTRMWEERPAEMAEALRCHDELLHRTVALHRGVVFKTVGDGFHAAFADPRDALLAAIDAQRSLAAAATGSASLQVRMALHTGVAEWRGGDWFGSTPSHTGRLVDVGHGGQVLVSDVTAGLLAGHLPKGVHLEALGRHDFRGSSCSMVVHQVAAPGMRAAFPPLRAPRTVRDNLPAETTSLVGRDHAAAAVCDCVHGARLVTLTGVGGTGKTRLGLRVAHLLRDRFDDGAWLIELGPLGDADMVPHAVATVLAITQSVHRPTLDALVAHLASREMLLVLDNCEHLLDGCAELARTILERAPGVRLLATSREALGVPGEVIWAVPSLAVPTADDCPGSIDAASVRLAGERCGGGALQLFVERANDVRPDLRLGPAEVAAAIQVCRRLDGIPLAVELAAARMRTLTIPEIASRLDDRFRLLTGGRRTAVPRQQTLLAAMDWSHDLLSETERAVFRRLGAFVGGWSLPAAEEVCAGDDVSPDAVLDLLDRLVAKSLVVVEPRGDRTRYRYLETVRQYACDRLAAASDVHDVRRRHAEHFADLAVAAEAGLRGPDEARWLADLDADRDNLRTAIAWSTGADGVAALRIAGSLWRYWMVRGLWREGRAHTAAALAAAGDAAPRSRAGALNGLGRLAWIMGDLDAAEEAHEQARALAASLGDRAGEAAALGLLGNCAIIRGDVPLAWRLQEEALALRQAVGDPFDIMVSYGHLGNVATRAGDLQRARELQETSLAMARDLSALQAMATANNNLGLVHHQLGNLDAAQRHYEEALAVLEDLGDRPGAALMFNNLGVLALDRGDLESALDLSERSLTVRRETGEARGIAALLINIAHIRARLGQLDAARAAVAESLVICRSHDLTPELLDALQAVAEMSIPTGRDVDGTRLLGAVRAARDAHGLHIEPRRASEAAAIATGAGERLGADAWQAAQAEGAAMSVAEAVALAFRLLE